MTYNRTYWVNGPEGDTALNADHLNNMEVGIVNALTTDTTAPVLVLDVGQSVPGGTPAGTVVIQKLS